MRENLRSRNLGINSYLGMLVITVMGGFSTLFLLHVIYDVSFVSVIKHTVEVQALQDSIN